MKFFSLHILPHSTDDAPTATYTFVDQQGGLSEIEGAFRGTKNTDQSIAEAHTTMIIRLESELTELKASKAEYAERASLGRIL